MTSLTIFDIDETLFHTSARVQVIKDNKVIRTLDNVEYNNYELRYGEEYDFSQFKSSEAFKETSKPMTKMIKKARAVIENLNQDDSKVIFVTARTDLDDRDLFISTFNAQGIDMSKVYVERAGNLGIDTVKAKTTVFRKYLDTGKYRTIRLFDDSMDNLTALMSLNHDYPNVLFEAYKVDNDSSITAID